MHYVAYGTPGGEFPAGVCRAAIVTELDATSQSIVSLCAVNPTGLFFNRGVPYDPDKKPGTWHWPERVPTEHEAAVAATAPVVGHSQR